MANEKGLTLQEVLVSIVLLSIILISFFSFFTNTFQFNSINDQNIQGMNLAREKQALFKEKYSGVSIKNMSLPELQAENFASDPNDSNYYIQTVSTGGFDIIIRIKNTPEMGSFNHELYQIHTEVRRELDNHLISETYSYLEGK